MRHAVGLAEPRLFQLGPPRELVAKAGAVLPAVVPFEGRIEGFPHRSYADDEAERCIEEVRSDDPKLASHLRIELEAGGLN